MKVFFKHKENVVREIVICMGSSCFARGNEKNLRLIEEFLLSNRLESEVRLSGNCCAGHCSKGPNLMIDGICYHNVNREMLIDLLNEKFLSKGV